MLKQLQTWFRIRNQRQARRPRLRIIPILEPLEERWCPAGDMYIWTGNANQLASNPANWMKNNVQQGANGTIPGNNAGDQVTINGAISNSNIVWDQDFTFSTLYLIGQYSGWETINSKLDLTGVTGNLSLGADGAGGLPGYLIVKFANSSGVFEIDNNAKIAAFSFNPGVVGGAQGTFLINGGTTTICTGTYNVNSVFAGNLDVSNVNEGETRTILEDKGKTPLVLAGTNTIINIGNYATMQVDGGAGMTLISEQKAGSNNYR